MCGVIWESGPIIAGSLAIIMGLSYQLIIVKYMCRRTLSHRTRFATHLFRKRFSHAYVNIYIMCIAIPTTSELRDAGSGVHSNT